MSMEFLPKPKSLNEYEVVEHEFATTFTKFINRFNMLERNIGLCIRSRMVREENRVTDKQLDTLSFHGKLDRLTKLVDQGAFSISKKGLEKDYHAWLRLMDKTRAVRNKYIHGDWDIYPSVEHSIRFTPMVWEERRDKSCTESMTLRDFQEQIEGLIQTFNQFYAIRRKFGI